MAKAASLRVSAALTTESWRVELLGARELAPHPGHVSNFRGVKTILPEPHQLVDEMRDSPCKDGASRLGAQVGSVSNSDPTQAG